MRYRLGYPNLDVQVRQSLGEALLGELLPRQAREKAEDPQLRELLEANDVGRLETLRRLRRHSRQRYMNSPVASYEAQSVLLLPAAPSRRTAAAGARRHGDTRRRARLPVRVQGGGARTGGNRAAAGKGLGGQVPPSRRSVHLVEFSRAERNVVGLRDRLKPGRLPVRTFRQAKPPPAKAAASRRVSGRRHRALRRGEPPRFLDNRELSATKIVQARHEKIPAGSRSRGPVREFRQDRRLRAASRRLYRRRRPEPRRLLQRKATRPASPATVFGDIRSLRPEVRTPLRTKLLHRSTLARIRRNESCGLFGKFLRRRSRCFLHVLLELVDGRDVFVQLLVGRRQRGVGTRRLAAFGQPAEPRRDRSFPHAGLARIPGMRSRHGGLFPESLVILEPPFEGVALATGDVEHDHGNKFTIKFDFAKRSFPCRKAQGRAGTCVARFTTRGPPPDKAARTIARWQATVSLAAPAEPVQDRCRRRSRRAPRRPRRRSGPKDPRSANDRRCGALQHVRRIAPPRISSTPSLSRGRAAIHASAPVPSSW